MQPFSCTFKKWVEQLSQSSWGPDSLLSEVKPATWIIPQVLLEAVYTATSLPADSNSGSPHQQANTDYPQVLLEAVYTATSLPADSNSNWLHIPASQLMQFMPSASLLMPHMELSSLPPLFPRQWCSADTESGLLRRQPRDIKGSLFKAWSRSEYTRLGCFTYTSGILPCWFIQLHFFLNCLPT